MHADEVDIDASLVGRLLAAQFPQWANLPIDPVRSAGTDNAIYRDLRQAAIAARVVLVQESEGLGLVYLADSPKKMEGSTKLRT